MNRQSSKRRNKGVKKEEAKDMRAKKETHKQTESRERNRQTVTKKEKCKG